MSTSGLSGKSHGDKSSASGGKKYQAVNINNVYSGKSLVGQKSSAAPRHGGLQSLGKATAVARRMPPPANLPSLKSESQGQDLAVNIVPSGVAGWGTQQQPTQPLDLHQDAKQFFDKKTPSDGISLRPAGGNAGQAANAAGSKGTTTSGGGSGAAGGTSPGSTAVASQPGATSTTGGRPTWSTRIGTSSSNSSFFAAQTAQDYPKLMNESESGDGKVASTAPSLRPQRSGNWKSGGGHGIKQGSESPPPSQNGRERSRSLSPASSDHHPPPSAHVAPEPVGPPYGQGGYGQRQGGYGPYPPYPPHHAYPPTLYGPHRGPFPPHYVDYRYGPGQGPPPPPPPLMQGRYGPGQPPPPNQQQPGGPNRGRQGDGDGAPIPPPQPEHFRGGPPPPVPRGNDYGPMGYMRGQQGDYGPPPPRDGRGEHWTAPPAPYYQTREPDMRYRGDTVWSDDEGDDRRDRRYARDDARRNKSDKQHAWSDSEDRYGEQEWSGYEEPPREGQGAPNRQGQPNMRPGGQYPPPPLPAGKGPYAGAPPIMHGRDNRYGHGHPPIPPMQMQQRYPYPGYMPPYDQRHMPPMPLHMNYPQPPHPYGRNRGPHDIEAEEEEEIARQQQQQYARDAAMERSKQKRRQGQQTANSGAAPEHHNAPPVDNRYGGAIDAPGNEEYDDSEADRSSSRESYGNKQGNRRPPQMPPRFARQGDQRSMPPPPQGIIPGQQQFNYGRPYPPGAMPNQYDNAPPHLGQGDGNYYDKRSARQPGPNEYPGTYDIARRYEAGPYRDEKRAYGPDDSEAPVQGGRKEGYDETPPGDAREKQLKRPDSKESLSSRSDRSSKGDKNSGSSGNSSVARGTRLWPKENATVKEEDTAKLADVEDDNEEDQKFETLSKPNVVVKRTMAPAAPEKPKEQEKPATAPKSESPSLNATKSTAPNAPTQKKEESRSSAASSVQKSQSQQAIQQQASLDRDDASKKNVWEQRKEQFENKHDPMTSSKDGYGDDARMDQQGGYDEWGSSSRGRGMARGRGRREFVSSRRMHGHSVGGGTTTRRGGNRGTTWEKEPGSNSFGRRRGGSLGYGSESQPRPKPGETETSADKLLEGEKKEMSPTDGETEKENMHLKIGDPDGEQRQSQDQQHQRGGKAGRGRGRGAKRGNSGSAYGSEQDWGSRIYATGGGAVFSRTRGGSAQGYNYRGYDEVGYGEEEDMEYDYHDSHRRYHQNRNVRGVSRGHHAMPPRFQGHEKSSGTYGGGHQNYRQNYGTRRSGVDSHARSNAAHSAKSPTGMKRENQSEGNDEWETASESSDVGERHKQEDENDTENTDRKKQPSGPKSFSSQRRAPDRRRGGSYGADGRSGGQHRRGGHGGGSREFADSQSNTGGKSADVDRSGNGQYETDEQKLYSGSKNAIVASHQASSNRADPKTSDFQARSGSRKTPRKDEKQPASKPGALATVDISNIAGVVVIDDQPDITVASENHDGFQEVVSKKRLKKDVQHTDEKDRKSQSPSNRSRLQPHSGSIGSKSEKVVKKSTNHGTPASVSASASTRSSAGDSTGAMTMQGNNVWDRKNVQSVPNTTNANTFGGRQVHSVEHQHYRPMPPTSTIPMAGPESNPGSQANMPSKTGVEIWGTPDPIPFSGANEQATSKCVSRPTKTVSETSAVRPKSVEFIADSLNKVSEDAGVKLDFTFDASLGPFRDPKQNPVENVHRHNAELDLDNNSENSPSADQLSEKIASVKKVWDVQGSMAGGDMEDTGKQFFGAASDAETAAIVSSAASLVSAAVLQSVHVDHPSGYDGESTKADANGPGQATVASGSSSKAEGPNVAKVRPQQMLMEQQAVASASQIIIGQDDFTNNAMSMNMGYASGTSTPLYAFTAGNTNSLFSAQFPAKGDFGMNPAQSPLSSYAQFPAPSNRSVFNQPAYVLPPTAAVSQSMELPFGNQLRSNLFGTADQNVLFGTAPTATYVSQPIRTHSAILTQQQAPMSKPSTVNVYGNVQGSFVLQDGGMSLFSHPPPSFGSVATQQPPPNPAMVAARATPGAPTAQQTSSPGGFDFSQPPPPAPTAVSITQPPPLTAGTILQAHILQAGAPNMPPPTAQMANFGQGPPPSYGWGQQKAPPPPGAIMQGARKQFNPTIGPPNSQKTAGGMVGLVQAPIGHIFGAPPQALTIATSSTAPGQHNFVRRGGSGAKGQNMSIDQAKRDGDLLQQMDKFINSGDDDGTSGQPEEAPVCAESNVAYQQVN